MRISGARGSAGSDWECVVCTAHMISFLDCEFTRELADQHSIVMVHDCFSFLFLNFNCGNYMRFATGLTLARCDHSSFHHWPAGREI